MKFKFFNDTGRIVTIHPATYEHGCNVDNSDAIMPLQERLFILPDVPIPSSNYGTTGQEMDFSCWFHQ